MMRATILTAALVLVAGTVQAQEFECTGGTESCSRALEQVLKATATPTMVPAGCENNGEVVPCASQASVDALAKRLDQIECEVVMGRTRQLSKGALEELCRK